jgi:hypothetical protein
VRTREIVEVRALERLDGFRAFLRRPGALLGRQPSIRRRTGTIIGSTGQQTLQFHHHLLAGEAVVAPRRELVDPPIPLLRRPVALRCGLVPPARQLVTARRVASV